MAALDLGALSRAAEAELQRRLVEDRRKLTVDIVDWGHINFILPESRAPIRFHPHQAAVLRLMFRRVVEDDPRIALFPSLQLSIGHFPFANLLWSQVKKSGKTTIGAVVGRFIAETQTRMGEIYCCGNDMGQAKEREFAMIGDSIKATPGCLMKSGESLLPGRWRVQATQMTHLPSDTTIRAVSVDAPGEAGGNPDLTLWTETWGIALEAHKKFWAEMTPVPTKRDSMRFVETYAGFEGESEVLEKQFEDGKDGRQLTAGELSACTGAPLDAFEETQGDPDALVPIWVNETARLCMYWDDEMEARRMPWQRGEIGRLYYREEEKSLPPHQYERLHFNRWKGSVSEFVPIELFDRCRDDELVGLPFNPGDSIATVLSVDAATTGDCFGIVAVTRNRVNPEHVDVRAVKKWDPPGGGGHIDYDEPEAFLRWCVQGGCAAGHPQYEPFISEDCPACMNKIVVPGYNVLCITYDPHQLESMMQRIRRDLGVWCYEFDQGNLRLIADKALYDLIVNQELHHDGDPRLREHIQNAKAKLEKEQDSKLRIVKKHEKKKVDLAVALSMGAYHCKYLFMENAP